MREWFVNGNHVTLDGRCLTSKNEAGEVVSTEVSEDKLDIVVAALDVAQTMEEQDRRKRHPLALPPNFAKPVFFDYKEYQPSKVWEGRPRARRSA